jgi:hypothetical protein
VERRSLRSVFGELAELERSGVISGWAMVGAVAALFHAEVTRTYDLDVAVLLPPSRGKLLLTPLYEQLRERGFDAEGEHVRIHGVPVQFLAGDPPLWREAIAEARRFDYDGIEVPVAGAEHLIAMALEAPSARRRERAALLLESGAVDRERLRSIVSRYHLRVPEGWNV